MWTNMGYWLVTEDSEFFDDDDDDDYDGDDDHDDDDDDEHPILCLNMFKLTNHIKPC